MPEPIERKFQRIREIAARMDRNALAANALEILAQKAQLDARNPGLRKSSPDGPSFEMQGYPGRE